MSMHVMPFWSLCATHNCVIQFNPIETTSGSGMGLIWIGRMCIQCWCARTEFDPVCPVWTGLYIINTTYLPVGQRLKNFLYVYSVYTPHWNHILHVIYVLTCLGNGIVLPNGTSPLGYLPSLKSGSGRITYTGHLLLVETDARDFY